MSASYTLWLCSPAGERLMMLDRTTGLALVRSVNAPGAWSIGLPGDVDLALVREDALVEIWRTAETTRLLAVGVVDDIKLADQGGYDAVTIAGGDSLGLLGRRVVAYAATSAQATKSGAADDLMKAVVRENCGALATNSNRNWTAAGLSVEANTTLGATVNQKIARQSVLKVLQNLADASAALGTAVYFDLVPVFNGSSIGFEFRTATGQLGADRTYASQAPTVFGREWGNLAAPVLEYDYSEVASVIYAGGQGEGDDRAVVEVEDTARSGASPWGRREKFINASSQESTAELTAAANAALAGSGPRVRFAGALLSTPQTRYGIEWQFGDRVTATYAGRQFDGLVSAVRLTVGPDGAETIEAKIEVEQ